MTSAPDVCHSLHVPNDDISKALTGYQAQGVMSVIPRKPPPQLMRQK